MISDKDIITFQLPPWVVQLSQKNSQEFKEANTPSHLRHRDERGDTVIEDNMTGNLIHYAFCRHFFGQEGVGKYLDAYWVSNKFPEIRDRRGTQHVSDMGYDVLRLNIDFKGSFLRTTLPMIKHRAPVRPYEMHRGHVYCFGLISADDKKWYAHLLGWAKGTSFPDEPLSDESSVFNGAYILPASELSAFIPWKWEMF